MATASATPPVTAKDRLGMTLFFAIIFHGILILGVTFISEPSAKQKIPPSLSVILVNTTHSSTPEKADYLAQVSQDGGGNSEEKVRPTDLFSANTLSQQPGIAAEQQTISTQPQKQEIKKDAVITQNSSTLKTFTHKKTSKENNQNEIIESQQKQTIPARLVEELSLTYQEYSQKPKEKFIHSRTKEYVAASYMHQWVDKVERLGNADYPDEAIRNKLSGTLILDVVINSDGSLRNIELRRSSGHQILDDAAKRIVKMASPYSPFPKKLEQQADVIHITRSWKFHSTNELKTF
ncbi:MAG: TonB family protein [Gammaproteobacteria bacterium]|nr:TonB family protein [Gammaproteobacteria bacterium]MDH5734614.1 TonB family protein [Gammaproteobacteria bacterium]